MHTIVVQMSVMASEGMSNDDVIAEAQRLLPVFLDGTDFMSINVVDAFIEK